MVRPDDRREESTRSAIPHSPPKKKKASLMAGFFVLQAAPLASYGSALLSLKSMIGFSKYLYIASDKAMVTNQYAT